MFLQCLHCNLYCITNHLKLHKLEFLCLCFAFKILQRQFFEYPLMDLIHVLHGDRYSGQDSLPEIGL